MASSAYNPGLLGIRSPKKCGCQELLSQAEPLQHGWLRRRCWRNKLNSRLKLFDWPQYYVVIVDTCLYYYKNELAKAPGAAISLYGYNRVYRTQEVKVNEVPWCFKLEHIQPEMKSFYFAAPSEKGMIKWMAAIKKGMLAANNISSSSSGDTLSCAFSEGSMSSWGSSEYNCLEESVYNEDTVAFRQSLLVDELKGLQIGETFDRPDNLSETKSEKSQYETVMLTQDSEDIPDVDYDTLQAIPETNKEEPESNEYWNSVHFPGSKTEASEVINSIAHNGVFLVRKSEDGLNILQVYADDTSKKYRIFVLENGQNTLSQTNGPNFDSLEDLLFHYYSTALPHTNCCLKVPYNLHPEFIKNEKH